MASGTLLRVWLTLSVQSFGGGIATLTLIRRAAVDKQRWVTEAEFARFWGLVQLAPGINLLALTVMLGHKVAGGRGIVLSLTGLLLPSAALTVALTAVYVHFQSASLVQAALRGIIPAIAGIGVLTSWQIAAPLLRESRRQGIISLALSLTALVGSGLLAWLTHLPVLVLLLLGGLLCAAGNRRRTP